VLRFNSPPDPVASVSISPDVDTVVVHGSVQLQATLRDSIGVVLSGRQVVWASVAPAIASVDSTGRVGALALGTGTITATSEGRTGTAAISSVPKVVVGRDLPSLFAGDTTMLVATFRDAANASVATGPIAWSTSNPAVATVSGDGVVSGMAAGLATIAVSSSGGRDSQHVAVLTRSLRPNRLLSFTREVLRYDGMRPQTLWTMRPDGSAQQRVSSDTELVNLFDWSSDGMKVVLALLNYQGIGRSGAVVANADGSGDHLVASALTPRWSPDGSALAYHRGGGLDVWMVRADATGLKQLTFTNVDSWPVWSPDGRQLAFVHYGATVDVGTVHVDGTHYRLLGIPFSVGPYLHWSPDGKRLALTAATSGLTWLVNADGTGLTAVCRAGGDCTGGNLAWSPDGSRLAAQAATGIYVMDPDGGSAVAIASAGAQGPSWSPDGTLVAYVAPSDTGLPRLRIWIVQSDGTGPVDLTPNDTTNVNHPVWQP